MSKVNLDYELVDGQGKSIPSAPDDVTPSTLKGYAMTALLTPQDLDPQTAGLSYRLYTLAHRVKDGGEVDLDADDVALIKQRLERVYPPWIVGQCWDALENRDSPLAPAPATTQAARAFPPRGGRK